MNKKNHSTAHILFKYYYKVYIPQAHLYSKEYITTFGIPTSGDREVDRNLANAKTLTQMTIVEMAEYLDEGANLTLEEPEKSVEIYKVVKDHLSNWQRLINNPYEEVEVPVEDLRKLDALAAEVFKIARIYMKEEPTGSKLFDNLNALTSRRFLKRVADTPEERAIKNVNSEYKPVADTIAKTAFERRRQWR
ncbi:MAG: hypothetical protein IBX57_00400 [Gammaproteobacteria bacterium]|nr:hypothetical protein [Gammaproteobacteria bacterium]